MNLTTSYFAALESLTSNKLRSSFTFLGFVIGVGPLLQGSGTVSAQGESTNTTLNGVTTEYETVRNAPIAEGEFINDTHLLGRSAVAVIGPTVADTLFRR